MDLPPGRVDSGPSRHAQGDPVEPARNRVALAHRAGPSDQHEERGLERILRIVRITEDLPADPQDHRSVPVYQGREARLRGLLVSRQERFQKLPVGQVPDHAQVAECGKLLQGKGVH